MHASSDSTCDPRPRGLWLARALPFPLDNGDHVYSARLALALAKAGTNLTFAGLAPIAEGVVPHDWPIRWLPVPGERTGKWRALTSPMPLVAAVHAIPTYRETLQRLSCEAWDFVVIDQYSMGWAIPYFRRSQRSPVIVHVSKDHEASVTRELYRKYQGRWPMRAALWQNHVKTAIFERRLVRRSELATVITTEDAHLFADDAPRLQTLVLTPGYEGTIVQARNISGETPRHVVMVGSFHWMAKQENLRLFAHAADAAFIRHGIELHVVGSMPDALGEELKRSCRSIRLHGFAETLVPHFKTARIAVVPELIGGGFKLKYLDYIFNRVPVATLNQPTAGLPREVADAMIRSDAIDALVDSIVTNIDRVDLLNRLQGQAFQAARRSFDWQQRGDAMLNAIRDRRSGVSEHVMAPAGG